MIKKMLFTCFSLLCLTLYSQELETFKEDLFIEKEADFFSPQMDVTGNNTASSTNLESEPSSTIYDVVSVISGDYTELFTDYVVLGPDPIQVQRVYSSGEHDAGSLCTGWHIGKYGMLNRWKSDTKGDKGYRATIIGGGGARTTYEEVDDKHYLLHKKSVEKGLTNTSSGLLSGRTNPLNDTLKSTRKKEAFTLVNGSGSSSIFGQTKHSHYYHLLQELKPNGLQVLYDYDSKGRVTSVCSKNKDGAMLAYANYIIPSKTEVNIDANGNPKGSYRFQKYNSNYLLANAVLPGGQCQLFFYTAVDKKIPALLTKKVLPEGRCLEIEYFQKGDNAIPFGNVTLEKGDPQLFRVKALKAPVGHDATPQYIYKFNYNIATRILNEFTKDEQTEIIGGNTSVYNVYNHLTRYYYNEGLRLDSVEKYTGEGPNYKLYSTERLFWNGPYLTNRIFLTKEKWAQYCKQYDYDDRGNVWRETLWGNLSGGNAKPIVYPPSGFPEYNGCEIEFKLFTYTDDNRNLMTSYTEGTAAKTTYEFVPGTDLLAKKLTGPIGSIRKREFFVYDSNGTLVHYIEDDGITPDRDNLEGVTERRIKAIIPTASMPIGLPALIEYRYIDLEAGQERLINREIYSYNCDGKPIKKEVYDQHAIFAYSERWEYDESGNLIFYEDPAGRVTTKRYDANNNLVYEQGPSPDFHVEYVYDYSNRLIKKETVLSNGCRLAERNYYDLCSNKVATEDIYGNRTEYTYDEFGRVTKATYPLVLNEDGIPFRPQTATEYTELSFPHTFTGPRGFSTRKRFTIKGAPYLIEYPDGSSEHVVYNVDGTIKKQTYENGSYTTFEYDDQKRETKKETFSPQGNLVDSIVKEYSGFKLLKEITLGGTTTSYTYDFGGKLVEMRQGETKSVYLYDTMGRRNITKTFYGNDEDSYTAQVVQYDVLNRVIEEREEDCQSNVLKRRLFDYDLTGNCCKTVDIVEAGESITRTTYNAFGQVIRVVDPLGNETKTDYHYGWRNALGQNAACRTTTHPNGSITVATKDAMGREASIELFDALNRPLKKIYSYYDPSGNKARQLEIAFSSQEIFRTVTTVWQYDSRDRLTATIEAAGTPEQKQTAIIYNQQGQKEAIIKPDGTVLHHAYDSLGRLSMLNSSDGTVSLSYAYDFNGNAIRVDDQVKKTATVRFYDENNHILSETLSNGLQVEYTYDLMGRPLTTTLPDGSSIVYTYDASRLRFVTRKDTEGNDNYIHDYDTYGYGGVLLSESYAGAVGKGTYTYDVMGRMLSYHSTQQEETIEEYDTSGNMLGKIQQNTVISIRSRYAYDDQSQLISESGFSTNQYTYDSLHNRTAKNGMQQEHNNLNQVLTDGIYRYGYDPNGNLVSKEGRGEKTFFEYDAFDRLVSVSTGADRYEYFYDELNRRSDRTHYQWDSELADWQKEAHCRYLYHGQNEVGLVDDCGKLLEYRTLGVGKGAEIGATVLIEIGKKTYVPIHDHNGNISTLIDADNGLSVETYRYSAFGEESVYDNASELQDTALSPWRFSSKRVDNETGFVYFGRRYYAPDLGRFVTADPLGFEGGPNLYAYVLNNPLTHFDLYGLIGVYRGIAHTSLSSGFSSSGFSTSLGSLFITGREWLLKGLQLPGYAIEQLGLHLIPIPGVQDAVRAAGRLMQGRCLCKFDPWWENRSCYGDLKRTELDPSNVTVFQNGMMTSKDELVDYCQKASQEIGGHNIHYVYNASHGFMADLIECGLQKLGIKMHSSDMLAKYCGKLSQSMGGAGTINLYAHSQGGLISSQLKNSLSSSLRKQMVVNTFGSPTQIPKGDFGNVHNYVSSRDLVPWFDPLSMLQTCFKRTTNTTIIQSSYFGMDHSWTNDTYWATTQDRLYAQYQKN